MGGVLLRPLIKRLRKKLTMKKRRQLGLTSQGVTRKGKNAAGKTVVPGPSTSLGPQLIPKLLGS